MFRNIAVVVALAAAVALPGAALGASAHAKRPVVRHWHGYGFLPGYPPIPQDYRRSFPGYWYGGPQFYRGRWNGGGFGPCWRTTPIGSMWTCG